MRCRSGLVGWQAHLRAVYRGDFAAWRVCAGTYGLHVRLGYEDGEAGIRLAWSENPLVQGSVDPKDYERAAQT